jgi:hypothetical protein
MRTFAWVSLVLFLSVVFVALGLSAPGCTLFPPDDCASHLSCSATADDATSAEAGDATRHADVVVADVVPDRDARGGPSDAETGSNARVDAAVR